jgi:phosphoglucan,water dikinase
MSESPRIRIGNQTAFSAPPLAPFEYAIANGFDAFEFFPDKKQSGEGWEESDLSGEQRSRIRDTARSHDIRLSVHSPWPSDPLNPENRDALSAAMQFARDIGAAVFNIHFSSTQGTAAYLEAVIPLAEQLARSGIGLSVENTPDTVPEDFNELFTLIVRRRFQDLRHVGMCLDLGHANLCRSTRNDYLRFIDQLGPHVPLIHIHMHENYGDIDSHLPLFTGPAAGDTSGIEGFLERMEKRGFSGSVILEQWPQPQGLLNEARKKLLTMIRRAEKTAVSLPCAFVKEIADANSRFLSWKKRLEWIEGLFADNVTLTIEQLVYIAIYLRFLGTGEVKCSEDGGHYRPSVHATISRRIYRRLVRISSPENSFVLRKIYPWLPSFDREFIRAEPLTRIRDIAHRNDIPHELKQEIKVTLQNKLHRSAGPEDLETSAALLGKITAKDAHYPPAFVKEFMRFHEELRDFFHAGSLTEELDRIIRKEAVRDTSLISAFLGSLSEPERNLELLTSLREQFLGNVDGGTSSKAQQLQLADIRLEDFSFVLLSRLITAESEHVPWPRMMRVLSLGVITLRLSGFDPEECTAIESELGAWSQGFTPDNRTQLLRLKSTVERARRLAEGYCMRILALFSEKAETLGHALNVPGHAIKAFTEGDIRGHPVFPVSKLTSMLLRNIRALAALPRWDAIVTGTAVGRFISGQELRDLSFSSEEPVIALVEKLEGDEDVPAGLSGLIIAHDTALLSHFAVRARQMNLVCAACEDPAILKDLHVKVGNSLSLTVTEGSVSFETFSDRESAGAENIRGRVGQPVFIPDAFLDSEAALLSLEGVTLSSGGSKANGAKILRELSLRNDAGFRTPMGIVIPFGIMEKSLRASGMETVYRELVAELDMLEGNGFTDVLRKLQGMVAGLRVPEEIVNGVAKHFRKGELLMVRSSSNSEDLTGFAGAGVYDSVANVPPSDVAAAVSSVWSSLWTRRAVLSRKNAAIPHGKAHMAVLIQQMVVPDFSFIMHTINPTSRNRDEVYIEAAVGLGATLASARIPGIPYRFVFDKSTEEIRTIAFASFSSALQPARNGEILRKTVDYSAIALSSDGSFRNRIALRLGKVGTFVEKEMGTPHDIEGAVAEQVIYLVQTRPQQGNI